MRRAILAGLLLAGLVTASVTGPAGPASAMQIAGGLLTSGETATATVSDPNTEGFAFAGIDGRHADFTVTASSWSTSSGALLSWYRPDGSLLDQCPLQNAATECDIVPDTTGTWTAVVEPGTGTSGSVTFTYRTDQSGGPLKTAKAVTTTLARAGLDAYYTFQAVAGRPVMFTVSAATWSAGTTGYLFFYGPGSTTLFSHCTAKAGAECRIIPTKTGTWEASVSAGDTTGTGRVTFTCLPDLNEGYLTRYQTFTTKLTRPHQNATYTFPANKDQRTKLYVTATKWSKGAVVRLWIFPASGSPLIDSCDVAKKTLCTLVPTTTAHWRMEVDPQGAAVGTITMRRTQ